MVTCISLCIGIPIDIVSLFLVLTQTIVAIMSFKEGTEMVNKNNTVVCGAHGVASYIVGINKKYTTLQVPIAGSNPARSAIY